MQKRKILFGSYDTAEVGLWTLNAWDLSPAVYKSTLVEVPGRDGDLDLSTALTNGEPRYHSRTLTVRLESSEGDRLERQARIDTMTNWLSGWSMDIILPDDDLHYITGRVQVSQEYNDPAHAAVTVTAVCEPWRYAVVETVRTVEATAETATVSLANMGRRSAVPTITITGTGASVALAYGAYSWQLGAGVYQLPDIVLPQGVTDVTLSGSGSVEFRYREAVL